MALNLIRNARVFFTTNVNAATGAYNGHATTSATNTTEIQVQQGFSFNQANTTQNITLNEAGPLPIRGQRAFNTALGPADFSFNTYIRPSVTAGLITAQERVLWNALMNPSAIPLVDSGVFTSATYAPTTGIITITGTGFVAGGAIGSYVSITGFSGVNLDFNGPIKLTATSTATTIVGQYIHKPASTYAAPTAADIRVYFNSGWAEGAGTVGTPHSCTVITSDGTDVPQLQKFALIIIADTATYVLNNCALDSATIDFSVDAIASVAWAGKGTEINTSFVTPTVSAVGAASPVASGTAIAYKPVNTAANYLQNKLSTLTLRSNIAGVAGTSYTLALTGGSIQYQNNLNYKTPENLGVVNTPIGYTLGTRAVSGNVQAYMRTGTAGDAGALMTALLAGAASTPDNGYLLEVNIGGKTSGTRLEVSIDGAMLSIPTIQTQDVVSTQVNFVAQGTLQGTGAAAYDITVDNELLLRYFSI